MAGRNAFTPDEDTLLMKYLAKYNPGVQGRKGNTVYKTLVENAANKWSWSKAHPWSGWRDRYVNNQTEFDRRILRYQLKKNLPIVNASHIPGTKKTTDDDEPRKRKLAPATAPRKRVKVDEESRRDEEEESDGVVAIEEDDASSRKLYPDLTQLIKPSTKPVKLKPLVLRSSTSSDEFGTLPPTPTDTLSRPPTTANLSADEDSPLPKARPALRAREGLFTTRKPLPRPTGLPSDSDDDVEPPKQWPPQRKTTSVAKAPSPMKLDPPPPKPSPKKQKSADALPLTKRTAVPLKRPVQHVNAVASSSRVQLTPSAARRESSVARILQPSPDKVLSTAQSSDGHSPQSSLDWGSPVGGFPSSPSARIPSPPPPARESEPFDINAFLQQDERSSSEEEITTRRAPVLKRVTARKAPALAPRQRPLGFFVADVTSRNASVAGTNVGSSARRSRAPSPGTDTPRMYQLASPPRARPNRNQLSSPLSSLSHQIPSKQRGLFDHTTKQRGIFEAKQGPNLFTSRREPGQLVQTKRVDDTRRHSYPASASLQIIPPMDQVQRRDLETGAITYPRQSLPAIQRVRKEERRMSAPLQRRQPSVFSSAASVFPGSTSASPDAAEDAANQAFLMMAQTHGFSADVVRNLFMRTRSLKGTEKALLKMQKAAEQALEDEDDAEAMEVEELEPAMSQSHSSGHKRRVSGASTSLSVRDRTPASTNTRKAKRRSGGTANEDDVFRAGIRPLNLEPQDILAEAEYSPPSGSRAAALMRAAKRSGTTPLTLRITTPNRGTTSTATSPVPELERHDFRGALNKAAETARYMINGRR
ncbi:Myb-DNA-bind-2 domain-containing protein [Mycena kentingensis (nom. inval.)]|nr:Myb-DNA-bind-2 domain-containing protein [Mycena kentingensis (nom. inval.)]